jgi:hypothetical protein
LKICENEVVDEYEDLALVDGFIVEFFPGDHADSDEEEERDGGDEGEESDGSHGYHAISKIGR